MAKPQVITCVTWGFACALGGIRTPNLLIRSQMLYPLSYERRTTSKTIHGGTDLVVIGGWPSRRGRRVGQVRRGWTSSQAVVGGGGEQGGRRGGGLGEGGCGVRVLPGWRIGGAGDGGLGISYSGGRVSVDTCQVPADGAGVLPGPGVAGRVPVRAVVPGWVVRRVGGGGGVGAIASGAWESRICWVGGIWGM
jgi:hypothetical protein